MNKIDVYKLGFIIVLSTVCLIVLFTVLSMFVLKIPTTEGNSQIRTKLLDLLIGMWSTVSVILGYKLREITDRKKEENENQYSARQTTSNI
jgi:hypothetical protein